MRLLKRDLDSNFHFTHFILDHDIHLYPYAILSHRWFQDHEELTYEDIQSEIGREKRGYEKLKFCADTAARDGLQYFWVDTCCIKKSSDAELSESINSMYHWYERATQCYVYLSDVMVAEEQKSTLEGVIDGSFRLSEWFKRGWTLQELLAPTSVKFYSVEGVLLGNRRSLRQQIHEITNISLLTLQSGSLSEARPDEVFRWAKGRRTTRPEDSVYCLLGLLDVSLPVIYGEGFGKASARLEEEMAPRNRQNLEKLPVALDAFIDSFANQHQPSCLESTRIDLLNTINDWVDHDEERYMFWLRGMYGTGKSTLARSIARYYSSRKQLGASFFFSRGGGDAANARRFVTTIAVQLAQTSRTLERYICEAIFKNRDIASLALREQWRLLISEPISKFRKRGRCPLVVVIDALDECDLEDDVQVLVRLMAQTRSNQMGLKLRFFLTSRPELHIRRSFSRFPESFYEKMRLDDIERSIVDQDIFHFLEHSLSEIAEDFDLQLWPQAASIHEMVNLASGLFIWAATAVKFIREGRARFADRRLRALLSHSTLDATTTPEKQLDKIYITILEQQISASLSVEERREVYLELRYVLGSVANLFSPLSKPSLEKLLDVPSQDMSNTLQDLHSLLDIPENEQKGIRLHHPSFRDFLSDQQRSGDAYFWVDQAQAHADLMTCCIDVMSRHLKQDICDLKHPGRPVTDVNSQTLNDNLPPEVQYACVYWFQHLQKSGISLKDNDVVHEFLKTHFLHWLEALSYLKKVPEGLHGLIMLESHTSESDFPELQTFLYDAKRFTMSNQHAIQNWPLQTYAAALIFAPRESVVKKQFFHYIPKYIKAHRPVEHWSALEASLEGHTEDVTVLMFSPDNSVLASGSWDCTIRLWNSSSGSCLAILEGHSSRINTVAFSPSGTTIASGSNDRDIRLWLCPSGVGMAILQGHEECVRTIAYSTCGTLLASGSDDKTVRLWNVDDTACIAVFPCQALVSMVMFSATNKTLASTQGSTSFNLWNVEARVAIKTIAVAAYEDPPFRFSTDGSRLVSISPSHSLEIWDCESGMLLKSLDPRMEDPLVDMIIALEFLPQTNHVAFFTASSPISSRGDKVYMFRLWDTSSETFVAAAKLRSRCDSITALSDTRLVFSSKEGIFEVWDAQKAQMISMWQMRHDSAVFSANGELLASPDSFNTFVQLCNVHKLGHSHSSGRPKFKRFFLDDRGLSMALRFNNRLDLFNVDEVGLLITLESDVRSLQSVVFSPCGERIACAFIDGTIKIWDRKGAMTGAIKGVPQKWSCIALSTLYLVCASNEGILKIWNVPFDDWSCSFTALNSGTEPEGQSSFLGNVILSPDSSKLAYHFSENLVEIYDFRAIVRETSNSSLIGVIQNAAMILNDIMFSSNNERIAGCGRYEIKLWDGTGNLITSIACPKHTSYLAFSPDSRLLAFGVGADVVSLVSSHNGDSVMRIQTDRLVTVNFWLQSFSGPSRLFTNRGSIDIDIDIVEGDTDTSPGKQPELIPTLLVSNEWIEIDSQPLIWLPPDYRTSTNFLEMPGAAKTAVGQHQVVFNHQSRDPVIVCFDFAHLPLYQWPERRRVWRKIESIEEDVS